MAPENKANRLQWHFLVEGVGFQSKNIVDVLLVRAEAGWVVLGRIAVGPGRPAAGSYQKRLWKGQGLPDIKADDMY